MPAYRSTGPKHTRVQSFRDALFQGQAADGGLLLPETIPRIAASPLHEATWLRRATAVMQAWLDGEIAAPAVATLCRRAFDFPVPVRRLNADTWIAELFHGPTAAFKDFGARFMAQAMAALSEPEHPFTILVATSGDTGSAVAQAFSGVDARVVLLYPAGRVSPFQELQLTAVPENCLSVRVEGTFDDCQAMVKAMFADSRLAADLGLTSANSINIGRLLPQSAYALHASLELSAGAEPAPPRAGLPGKHRGAVAPPQPPLVVVPSGNLGNLTGVLLAKRLGAPIGRVLAALNRNDVFARFLATGKTRAQPATRTPSNAMDVGNPSNLARVVALYRDDLRALRRDVTAASVGDEETLETMRWARVTHGLFVCPHTAVGLAALRRHRDETGDAGAAVVFATAHPGKFADVVAAATGETPPPPAALAALARSRRQPRDLRPDAPALAAFLRRLR
jgi:threonine synthase